jgi:hypothetical protein
MFVLRVEMYKLCSAIYRTTLFTTLTSTLTLYFIQHIAALDALYAYARVEGLNIQEKIHVTITKYQ